MAPTEIRRYRQGVQPGMGTGRCCGGLLHALTGHTAAAGPDQKLSENSPNTVSLSCTPETLCL